MFDRRKGYTQSDEIFGGGVFFNDARMVRSMHMIYYLVRANDTDTNTREPMRENEQISHKVLDQPHQLN